MFGSTKVPVSLVTEPSEPLTSRAFDPTGSYPAKDSRLRKSPAGSRTKKGQAQRRRQRG